MGKKNMCITCLRQVKSMGYLGAQDGVKFCKKEIPKIGAFERWRRAADF